MTFRQVSGHSLAVFRLLFGIIIFVHGLSSIFSGVAYVVYVEPERLFPYMGFEWLPRLGLAGVYGLHIAISVLGLLIAVGLFFRAALLAFLISFLYLFLLEEPYYQNHYYLVLLYAVLLLFSHAGKVLSLDAWRVKSAEILVPELDYILLRFQTATVYIYAGVAKINPDWLRGEPLREWLGHRGIGEYAMFMSYGGLLFDILVIPALLWPKTRMLALGLAVIFHTTNQSLFSIGIFPWLGMSSTLLFLDYDWPSRVHVPVRSGAKRESWALYFAVVWCALQVILPLRHLAYPGRVAWTLDGFYFSWMMRLNTRAGTGFFYIHTPDGQLPINPEQLLPPLQASAVRTNPNEILKFARFLREDAERKGQKVGRVTADLRVRLNDHPEKPFTDPAVDLSRVRNHWLTPSRWIMGR